MDQSRSKKSFNPGARIFKNALASIQVDKSKSKQDVKGEYKQKESSFGVPIGHFSDPVTTSKPSDVFGDYENRLPLHKKPPSSLLSSEDLSSSETSSRVFNQWEGLPDYTRLNFLEFKCDVGFIDSHCHLDLLFERQRYPGTYSDYMLRHHNTVPASYEGCIAIFCNPRTFHKKAMWEKYLNENGVWAAFGCHPKNANVYNELFDSDLCSALNHPKVRALGEIGLDYSNRNHCTKKTQHAVFRRQLNIAVNRKLPLVIHCRDANEDCLDIMTEMVPKSHRIHLHCFTANWDWAQRWLNAFPNLFIGLTNLVTFESARTTHQVAVRIPLNRLLLETDAPYFVPRMIARSTKWSHPGMAIHVAAQIATMRNLPLREVLFRTRQNTRYVYNV